MIKLSLLKYAPRAIIGALTDHFLSLILFPNRHKKLLLESNIPQEHKEAALRSFEEVEKLDKLVRPYKLKAPFVMLKVVSDLKWEDEKLPEKYSAYDNERGLNGDGHGWVFDSTLGYEVPIKAPLEDTPESRANCYYLKGKNSRSLEARYVWLGERNRASKFAHDLGPERNFDLEEWGDRATSNGHEGTLIRRMGRHYEIFAIRKVKFIFNFCVRTRYGYKIGNTVGPRPSKRAMPVTIPFSIQGWDSK